MRTNNVQTLTFLKQFGKHNVDVLAGHEYYRQNVKYLEGNARYEFSPYIQELYAYANPYSNTSYQDNYNVEGFFGRAQYNYDDKYFASASYRRDGS
ncbi:receptor antigen RagA, partial [human gut metagenome]